MSPGHSDEVSMTTGMLRRGASDLIFSRTSRPLCLGRFRSSKIRPGRERSGWRLCSLRNSNAAMPSSKVRTLQGVLPDSSVSTIRSRSAGLSSMTRTSIGSVIHLCMQFYYISFIALFYRGRRKCRKKLFMKRIVMSREGKTYFNVSRTLATPIVELIDGSCNLFCNFTGSGDPTRVRSGFGLAI